jgi:hypothetical protein
VLIRVDGRHDGVKEYLENGQKKGREHTRDQLDERVVLVGDLEVTDAIVQSINVASDVDRYLSITLSFKEDEVSFDTMAAAVKDFQEFVFAGYRPDELNFYAEAHLPKIKSYSDRRTGQSVERKPHIHVVIPKLNLITGNHAEPLGYVKSNERFMAAIQEHINAKYGLASPRENRRVQLTDASEMISRYRGDLFKDARSMLKESVLDAVLDRKIERYDDFMRLLAEHGETRLRNAGRSAQYPNIKLPGDAKGVNLKEHVFSRAFIELPAAEKLQHLAADIKTTYEVAGEPRDTVAQFSGALNEWHATRARENKYLNSGNARAYRAYQEASPADRLRMLDERERGFYAQHLKDHHEPNQTQPRIVKPAELTSEKRRIRRVGRVYEFKRAGARDAGRNADTRNDTRNLDDARGRSGERGQDGVSAADDDANASEPVRRPSVADAQRWQWGAGGGGPGAQAKTLNGLRGLSGVPVVRFQRGSEVLLPHHAPGVVEHGRAQRPDTLRRHRDRERGAGIGALPALRPASREYAVQDGQWRDVDHRWQWRNRQGADRPPGEARGRGLSDAASLGLQRLSGEPDREERGRSPSGPTGRVTDSVVSQQVRNASEKYQRASAHAEPAFAEIRRWLKADRLLAELSHSHGVQPEKYPVVQGRDGADRIRSGSRHLNVSDFLTKELNLPWQEAAPILRGAYARQQGQSVALPARENPRVALWQEYAVVRDAATQAHRTASSAQRDTERARHRAIKTRFETRRAALRVDLDLSYRQQRSELSLARMNRLADETALRGHIKMERDTLKLKYGSAGGSSFAEFLTTRAQDGDERALRELRRTRRLLPEANSAGHDDAMHGNEIRAVVTLDQQNEIIFRRPALSHQVHGNGDVTYRHDGRDVVRDRGVTVLVLQKDQDAIETGLRLAHAKYGSTLQLAGSDAFQREAASVAADAGIKVRFSDDRLNRVMMDRVAARVAERYESSARSKTARGDPPQSSPLMPTREPDMRSPSIDPPLPPARRRTGPAR